MQIILIPQVHSSNLLRQDLNLGFATLLRPSLYAWQEWKKKTFLL